MSQVVQANSSPGGGRFPWVIGTFAAAVVIFFTTFAKVMEVPVVSSFVGGTIFDISGYIGGLTTQYAPWLSKMMAEATGASTARLLKVGSVALVGMEVVALGGVAFLALHILLVLAGRKAARSFGLLGFSLALVVPVLMFAVARFVAWEMANDIVTLHVLAVPRGPQIQLAAALLGLVCCLLLGRSQTATNTKEKRHA